MTEINSAHPLWEPAKKLYSAWMAGGGLQTLAPIFFDNLSSAEQAQWLGVAQAAKDGFGEYQDDLVAELDRVYAAVRESVSLDNWNYIQAKLGTKVAEPGTPSHLIADDEISAESRPVDARRARSERAQRGKPIDYTELADVGPTYVRANEKWLKEQVEAGLIPADLPDYDILAQMEGAQVGETRTVTVEGGTTKIGREGHRTIRVEPVESEKPIVGGPAVLPGIKSAIDDMTGSLTVDTHAHARITALQREVAFQLTQLWKMVASEVAGTRPSHTAVTDYHNQVWGCLKEADNQVAIQLYGDPEEITRAR